MPRANRYHLPGLVWHITHRCHDREFLLKFQGERDRYRYWLFQTRKRYGLSVLNFVLTSNHVHLLVYDGGQKNVIESSMQLVAGRMGQEYNARKGRKGAFWEDRYHATAIQSGRHLRNCFTYIDLNMVRAGRVSHPKDWLSCGYNEIQRPRERYRILDFERIQELLGLDDDQDLAEWQRTAVSTRMVKPLALVRQPCWTEALAIGDPSYLKEVADRLGSVSRFRSIRESEEFHFLEEPPSAYRPNFSSEMDSKGAMAGNY